MKLRIEAGGLVDVTRREYIENAAVLVDGDRIVEAGNANEVSRGDTAINLPESTLMPGVVDAHTHISFNMGEQPVGALDRGNAVVRSFRACRYLREDLLAGVTLVRVVGEMEFLDITAKHAVEAGVIPGPRMITATRGLAATNGHGGERPGNAVDGPDEMRKAVRTNLRHGADLTKLLVTGSVDHFGGHFACGFTPEEIAVAAEETHRVGKPVCAHAVRSEDVRVCVENGVDAIEHGHMIDDAAIQTMLDHDCWLVATLAIVMDEELLAADLEENPEFAEVEWLPRRAAAPEAYRQAISRGVRWTCGTDAMHGRMDDEIAALVEIGINPMDVLVAATQSGADICGLSDQLGSLDAGKLADLIAVRGNPLEDISAVSSIDLVIKNGVRVDDRVFP